MTAYTSHIVVYIKKILPPKIKNALIERLTGNKKCFSTSIFNNARYFSPYTIN